MKPKVLVAEDNVDHLELLSDALSEENLVIGTDSKEGCMEYLATEQFDLVVLDYNLKKNFSGFDILREITLKYPYLPVIMVTAYGNEELAVKVMKIGAKDYIRKTLDNNYIDRIVTNVRTLVKKKDKGDYSQIKKESITYLRNRADEFIVKWKEKIFAYEEKFDIHSSLDISDTLFHQLFDAFIDDIEGDRISRTIETLTEIFNKNSHDEQLLLYIELLNVTFREISHDLLLGGFPDFFDYGSALMEQINWIVDANDLVLGKEYEKAINKTVDEVRRFEHVKANDEQLRQLREELQKPILTIRNHTRKIIEKTAAGSDNAADAIIEQIRQIEEILEKYEKENRNFLRDYRENIQNPA